MDARDQKKGGKYSRSPSEFKMIDPWESQSSHVWLPFNEY